MRVSESMNTGHPTQVANHQHEGKAREDQFTKHKQITLTFFVKSVEGEYAPGPGIVLVRPFVDDVAWPPS